MSNGNPVIGELPEFNSREWELLRNLMNAEANHGLPEGFDREGVTVALDTNSGYLFLTNATSQYAFSPNGEKLEMWYTCAECERKGFAEDIDYCADCGLCGDCCTKSQI